MSQDEGGATERATYVVRLWRRPGLEWHGDVEHVQTGERLRAREPARVLDQLRSWLRPQVEEER